MSNTLLWYIKGGEGLGISFCHSTIQSLQLLGHLLYIPEGVLFTD